MDEQILKMRDRGMTATDIAEVLGVSRVTINNHARKLGINFPKSPPLDLVRKLMEERKDEVLEKYAAGLNTRKIAKLFRSNEKVIETIFQEWNVETRKRPENWGKLEEYNEQIIKMHSEGLGYCAIGARLGFDPSSILKHGPKIGLMFEPQIDLNNHIEEIISMRDQKLSLRDIAKKYDVTHGAISDVLKRH